MATALDLTARALDGEESVADDAIESQRELRDELSELARGCAGRAHASLATHSSGAASSHR
jgi:hypothetical protein